MADEKLNTGPAENISPEAAEPIATPEQAAASEPQQEQTEPAIPEPGDVVVSFDKINELMAEKRQNARAEVEKAENPEAPEAAAPGETPQPANTEEPKKPRRGRPPKAEKAATENQKSEKSAEARKGRPPKADKAAPGEAQPPKPRDKVGLLTKCLIIYYGRKNGNKKDAHRRHPIYFIILFKFKAVAERRQ